jgi:hypothetical protein
MLMPCVYVVATHEEQGYIKIGRTNGDPYKRMTQLQTGNPMTLIMACIIECPSKEAAIEVERILQDTFVEHLFNREWFKVDLGKVLPQIRLAVELANALDQITVYEPGRYSKDTRPDHLFAPEFTHVRQVIHASSPRSFIDFQDEDKVAIILSRQEWRRFKHALQMDELEAIQADADDENPDDNPF